MPCDDLEGWGGAGEAQEGVGINRYIIMTDSCWCMAETTTTLQSNYAPIHFFFLMKPAKGEGRIGSLGLADANSYTG